MKISAYVITESFQSICMVLSLFFSLRLINGKKIIPYMRNFYWYSIVGASLVLLRWCSKNYEFPSKDVMGIISNYSILFHFTFLSMFISSLLRNQQEYKFLTVLFVITFLITLFYLIVFPDKKQHSTSYAIANLGLVISCVTYFSTFFREIPDKNLLREPSFWIIGGIFLCMSAAIPILSLHRYLRDENYINEENRKNFYSIVYFAYGTMHLFFIKAYLCSQITQE